MARSCVRALDDVMLSYVRTMASPIPPEALTGMKENYTERLPKTMRVRSRELNTRRGPGFEAATRLGLVEMLGSQSLREFAQAVSGRELEPAVGRQVIAYQAGDYSGPHNDHHPENPGIADGYVDMHIMIPTPGVDRQYLVYEEDGHLTKIEDIASRPAIAVYHLPFWHYTTPLLVKPAYPEARRWLMLATFKIRRKAPATQKRRAV